MRFTTGAERLVGGAALSVAALVLSAGPALAADTEHLANGSFGSPGTEGATPTSWTPVDLGAETAPHSVGIGAYDSSGTYPPPVPVPGTTGFASEVFYQAGSATGVEGFGGSQQIAGLTQAQDPQLSYSTVATNPPATSNAAWAGSVLEVDLTSGGTAYQLRYFDSWLPAGGGSYPAAPTSTATTGYVVGPVLTTGSWYTSTARDVAQDAKATFGVTTFAVTGVTYGVLEDTTSTAKPYPNMTGYFTNLSLSDAPGATPALPESALAVGLPVVGVVAGLAVLRRRRRTT